MASVTAGTMLAPALVRRASPASVMVAGLLIYALGCGVVALALVVNASYPVVPVLPVLVAGSVLSALEAGPLVTLVPDALPAGAGATLLAAARGAFTEGFVAVAATGAVLMLVAAGLMAAVSARRVPAARPTTAVVAVGAAA